jgi:hypothetical protein
MVDSFSPEMLPYFALLTKQVTAVLTQKAGRSGLAFRTAQLVEKFSRKNRHVGIFSDQVPKAIFTRKLSFSRSWTDFISRDLEIAN